MSLFALLRTSNEELEGDKKIISPKEPNTARRVL
jgi:hypothetical protein